jgi:hypothetical protein
MKKKKEAEEEEKEKEEEEEIRMAVCQVLGSPNGTGTCAKKIQAHTHTAGG